MFKPCTIDLNRLRCIANAGESTSFGLIALIPLLALILGGCVDEMPKHAGQAHVPSVIAVKAESRAVEKQDQFIGRVVAAARVELRARVSGFLKSRGFTEGQRVAVGDELFVIEPDQYQAVVAQRKADVAKAQADEENAHAQYNRGQELLKSKNIARAKVDELRAAESIATASIAQAKAALAAAELDLGYTRITAPIAGRIGLEAYSVGNLVGPSSDPLATIVSHDPIYVEFPVTSGSCSRPSRRSSRRAAISPTWWCGRDCPITACMRGPAA